MKDIYTKDIYTIVIMSSAKGSVCQFSIGHGFLRFLYFLFFIMVVCAVGGIGYGISSRIKLQSSDTQLEKMHAENEQMRIEKQNQLKDLDKEMDGIREMANTVRRVLGIDQDNQDKSLLGQGGLGAGTEKFDDNEQDDLILKTQSEHTPLMENAADSTGDSPKGDFRIAQINRLKSEMKIVYDRVQDESEKLNESPFILPIKVPENSKGEAYWFSSGFGYRKHPITKKRDFHNGLDISAPKGTPVIAPADGEIIKVLRDRFLGRMIRIRHKSTQMETMYGHLSKFADGVPVGRRVKKKVKRGEIIGYVGNSGVSTGSHLHYGVYDTKKRRWKNPMDYISLSAPPSL